MGIAGGSKRGARTHHNPAEQCSRGKGRQQPAHTLHSQATQSIGHTEEPSMLLTAKHAARVWPVHCSNADDVSGPAQITTAQSTQNHAKDCVRAQSIQLQLGRDLGASHACLARSGTHQRGCGLLQSIRLWLSHQRTGHA